MFKWLISGSHTPSPSQQEDILLVPMVIGTVMCVPDNRQAWSVRLVCLLGCLACSLVYIQCISEECAASLFTLGHQPAASWVNTTGYCKYSQVLLMMGENIARNIYLFLKI